MPPLPYRLIVALVLVVAGLSAPARLRASQPPARTGTLSGIVTAQQGRLPLRDVTVVVSDPTGHQLTATTDLTGAFRLPGLPAGRYRVDINLPGFRPANRMVVITAGNVIDLAIDLDLEAIVESTVVVAGEDQPLASSTTLSSSESVLAQTIDELDGLQGAMRMMAGVVQTPGGLSIKGGRATQSSVLLGAANWTDLGTGSSPIRLQDDAIRAIEVLPNPYAVEFGRFSTGVTVIDTHAGGDRWRGRLNNFIPSLRTRRDALVSILGVERFGPRFIGSGPAVKDRLFVAQSVEYGYRALSLRSRSDADVSTSHAFGSFTRLDAVLGAGHRLTMSLNARSERQSAINMNAFTPPGTAADLDDRSLNLVIADVLPLGGSAVLDSMVQVSDYNAVVGDPGQPGEGMELAPYGNSGRFFNAERRSSRVYQWAETWSKSFGADGAHLFRAGADLLHTTFTGLSQGAPVTIRRQDTTIARRLNYGGATAYGTSSNDAAVFVQDRWRPVNRLVLEGGVRLDYDGITGRINTTGRGGGVIALNESGRITLHGGAGLFYERTPSLAGVFDQFAPTVDTRVANDGVTIVGRPLTIVPRVQEPLETPRSWTWNAGLDHSFGAAGSLRVNYLDRAGTHELVLQPTQAGELVLSSAGRSTYREVEISGRVNPGHGLEVNGSYVRASGHRDANLYASFFGTLRAPIVSANESIEVDTPNRFVARVRYAPTDKWIISPVVEFRNGWPYAVFDDAMEVVPMADRPRFPNVTMVDLHVERLVKILRWRAWLGVRVSNLLNEFEPSDVQASIASPDFGAFYGSRPRQIRLQLRFP
jgi:hypothetical protein